MAYADPQSVTVDAVAHTLNRIGTPNPEKVGVYSSADGSLRLTIRQDKTANRFRREARLTMTKIAADPISAQNKEISTSVVFVVDEPRWGFTDAEQENLLSALATWFSASSNAARSKLLYGEL